MPYIKESERAELRVGPPPSQGEVGKLNYQISNLVHDYLINCKDQHGHPRASYKDYNDVIGVLECLKLELYRQVVAPYEDIKKDENGSVSLLDYELGD